MSLRERLVNVAYARAQMFPPYTGHGTRGDLVVIQQCRHFFPTVDALHSLIFTRDEGMHSCGWWKNPDYQRCWHLSLSFRDRQTMQPAPQDKSEARRWAELFFPSTYRMLWIEPPFSAEGKANDTYHYRLFVAEDWRSPLLPRGEVYTREFTKRGWKSWSDLHAEPQESSHT